MDWYWRVLNSVIAGFIEKWTDIEEYWTVSLQASLRNGLILKSTEQCHCRLHWEMDWYWTILNSVTAGFIEKWTDIEQHWTVLLQASLRNGLILKSTEQCHCRLHWEMDWYWTILNCVTADFIQCFELRSWHLVLKCVYQVTDTNWMK